LTFVIRVHGLEVSTVNRGNSTRLVT